MKHTPGGCSKILRDLVTAHYENISALEMAAIYRSADCADALMGWKDLGAAPELLEAAKAYLDIVGDNEPYAFDNPWGDRLEAAIKRIEGRG